MNALRAIVLLSLTFSSICWGSTIDSRLKEASDYITVKPSESLSILKSIDIDANLTEKQLIEWHVLNMRASLPLGKLDNLYTSIDAVFSYHQSPAFPYYITSITSALGIWLRKHNYLLDAEISYKCAYKTAETNNLRLIINNSLALLARENNDLESAKILFEHSAKMAKAEKNNGMIATVNFNQGRIAFELGDYQSAEKHFRQSLAYYQSIDMRAGIISVGTYLLFSFIVQDELINYQRLYPPILQQAEAFPNEVYKAFLAWVNAGYLNRTGMELSSDMRKALAAQFNNLIDHHEQALVVKHLAKPLGIELAIKQRIPSNERFKAHWFSQVADCQFNKVVFP